LLLILHRSSSPSGFEQPALPSVGSIYISIASFLPTIWDFRDRDRFLGGQLALPCSSLYSFFDLS
jgi:hypothetical protein